jgi:ribonuclease Z
MIVRIIKLVFRAFVLIGLLAPMSAHAQIKVTLLGTGTPFPEVDRFGPATLVEAGVQKLLFDVGRGATIRLWQSKVPLGRIDALFITHYHSDHTSGLADFWLTSLLRPPFGRRETALKVIGPKGAKALTTNVEAAYADDLRVRLGDQPIPQGSIKMDTTEFDKDGVVFDADGVKVTAFEVDHGATVKPAYGYRVDFQGHSVLISGDTRYNENLIKHGVGVDVLIHQVAMANPALMGAPFMQAILSHHTTAYDVGRVFMQTKPKLAVLTHFALFGNDKSPAPTTDDVLAEAHKSYSGPIEIGADLMSFEVSDTVKVHRP